jgi:hypothetical protein
VSEDEHTPVDRPIRLPVNPEHGPLVRALHNHVAMLDQVTRRVTAIEERICAQHEPVATADLVELGRAFRDEADSAHELARAAEKLAAGGSR